jgi:ABC-type Fe3+/spermidine/putrescine transport system ATPase subunit
MRNNEDLLIIEGLSESFAGKNVLEDVNLKIKEGEGRGKQ